MQALSVELEDDTVAALEAERELFGFESRQAYVRWIIEHRGSIDADGYDLDTTRDRLLADHGQRLAKLEEQVATIACQIDRDGDGAQSADDPTSVDNTAEPNETSSRTGGGSPHDGDVTGDTTDRAEAPGRRPRRDTPEHESPIEVRGSPRTVRQGPDSTVRSDDDERSNPEREGQQPRSTDHGVSSSGSTAESEPTTASTTEKSGGLSPERIARIREDPVHEDAGMLGNVESERLDELSRRAVATTRKRLNRDVQTGLEYTSSTRLAGAGVRPGEDLTDLDALSIPGRSAKTVEKRRHAVGRALAFLRDEDRARRSDFVDALYAECPAGYETADSWWGCIKEGLKQVEAVEGGEGTRVWRYRG
ncbi:hypothetical protein [Natronorubrum texcoconense]|uniref:Uncharacterized protein n=1 Tax=Natronorubrum texcoconense TaxID=1095776 RepID=A0A1G9AHG2_9EURY|nr:hypothetical protein [Natronorubrum texcoconense]SDK26264.1 hypothetical protein SAMN04515672_2725 [Natronorubrum texcoconense]